MVGVPRKAWLITGFAMGIAGTGFGLFFIVGGHWWGIPLAATGLVAAFVCLHWASENTKYGIPDGPIIVSDVYWRIAAFAAVIVVLLLSLVVLSPFVSDLEVVPSLGVALAAALICGLVVGLVVRRWQRRKDER